VRPPQGGDLIVIGIDQRRQFVKSKHNVSANGVLDLHAQLRRKAVLAAVKVAVKRYALFVHQGQALFFVSQRQIALHIDNFLETAAEAQYLETSTISKCRPVPMHKFTKPTGLLN
jgi:hypothetical protein